MASTNSGWPPLSTIYTTLSVKMVSRSSLGMLMSDINSSSTSEDWSRDSILTSGGAPGDRHAVDVAAALVGMAGGGGMAVDGWWVGG